jgi:AraC-like DNA-binding protein/mannose-6-phosphate isomerase-like protein (cupin superfamily)
VSIGAAPGVSRIRQLSTSRPRRQLRWTQDGSQSLRAYAITEDDEPCPCVSTRSGELNLVLEGKVVIEVGPAKQQVVLGAGDACLVPRGLPHAVRVPESGRVLMVDVQSAVADHGLRVLPAKALPARVFRKIGRAWTRRVPDALEPAREAAAEVVLRLESRAPLEIETTPATRRMMRAKQILEAHFADPPTLGELAGQLGTNEFYLLRSFKKHFSFSPLAYAQFLRTEHFVWELLGATSPRTLLRLSSEAGFGDYSTFERRIRDVFGRTPSSLVEDDPDGRLGPGE